MKIHKIILISLLWLFSLYSCQEPVKLDQVEFQPKLVLNCVFSPDSLFKVKVTHALSNNDTSSNILANADCFLFSENTLLDSLQHIGKGIYVSDIKAEIDKEYTIQVKHPNYPTASATSKAPQKPIITRTEAINNLIYDPYEEEYLTKIITYITDRKKRNDYYEFSYKGILKNDSSQYGFSSYFQSTDNVITNEGVIDYNPFILLFSDRMFKNKTYKLHYKINYIDMENYPDSTNYTVYLKYKSVSEAYYAYVKDISKQTEYYSNRFFYTGEPVHVYSNVKNGYGIFAGYSMIMDTLKYTKQ